MSGVTSEGVIQFHVNIKVEMNELAGWQPERITAFLNGIARVLRETDRAAKAKEAGDG